MNNFSAGQVNWAYQHEKTICTSDSDVGAHYDDIINTVSQPGDKEKSSGLGLHSIILDLSTTNFVDTVCVITLKNVRIHK